MLKQIQSLIWKEMILEWRQKYALNGIILYVVATVFVVYISAAILEPKIWNVLFWIIMLFASVNAIAKSFLQEGRGRILYYYTITGSQNIIIAKMIYNVLLMILLSGICILTYSIIEGNPVKNHFVFFASVILGAVGFSLTFTMISAIASKANNNATLMAILSFPAIIPIIKILLKISFSAMEGLQFEDMATDFILLLAIDAIIVTVALLLFPYLWRD